MEFALHSLPKHLSSYFQFVKELLEWNDRVWDGLKDEGFDMGVVDVGEG